jgi:formate hydrogenlyase subunit 3/multisubunit Na+/H+ antiporter MnhD subunit
VFLAAVTVIMGLGVGPVFDYAMETGQQLANSSQYIQAVLGVAR